MFRKVLSKKLLLRKGPKEVEEGVTWLMEGTGSARAESDAVVCGVFQEP